MPAVLHPGQFDFYAATYVQLFLTKTKTFFYAAYKKLKLTVDAAHGSWKEISTATTWLKPCAPTSIKLPGIIIFILPGFTGKLNR